MITREFLNLINNENLWKAKKKNQAIFKKLTF